MNLETKITIYKFTPQLFTLTRFLGWLSLKTEAQFSNLGELGVSGFSWLVSFLLSV